MMTGMINPILADNKVTTLTLALVVLSASIHCLPFSKSTQPTCGYESCNAEKPGMINVHLVPHTHDDVGWLMTVDQYYYKYVQWILDSVVQELAKDPEKRFIYVEQAFFSRWFEEQNNSTKELVRKLVNEGRLEFILGGWSMNDEAATHYTAIIDNHKLGFEYLRKNFGRCGRPKIGWQIDPFGHSREQASLFAQFGFDGLFFGRLDYQDKNNRQKTKSMEFVWKGSPNNLGSQADLFTGVLPNSYNPPDGFWFDVTRYWDQKQEEIMDDPTLHDYNVDKMVDRFITEMKQQATWYATDHLIATMGSDFNYVQAHMWFKEMDKLIKYVNARQSVGSKMNLLYSTPSCYLAALHKDGRTWPNKTDDFFPYADQAHGFWSGYFTSRPTSKHYFRAVNGFFQSVKQMAALANLSDKDTTGSQLHKLASVLGEVQHHDAITGTAKQAVAYDYNQRLAEGVKEGQKVIQDSYNKWMIKPDSTLTAPVQIFCTQLNVSVCSVTENLTNIQINLYNGLARGVKYYVRVPVTQPVYTVLDSDGSTKITNDVVPISPGTNKIPAYSVRPMYELIFEANLPPLGFKTYFATNQSSNNVLRFRSENSQTQEQAAGSIQGKYVRLDFDQNGNVASMTNLKSNVTTPLSQGFHFYKGDQGNNSQGGPCSSGAYIFRPISSQPTPIPLSFNAGVQKGQLVQEAYQQVGDWVSAVWRVYLDQPWVELEWTVGPIPVDDKQGKEVITRYNLAGFNNGNTFYTDSNGRETLKRVLNYRPTWQLNQTEPVAGNYFPVDAFISIKDESRGLQFTVLTDRAQGGSSLNPGDVELMLHRRLLVDDNKGVGEPLNEKDLDGKGLVARGTHYLVLDTTASSWRTVRRLARQLLVPPVPAFSTHPATPQAYSQAFNTQWSGLHTRLPPALHLLTLERLWDGGPANTPTGQTAYLLRLEHAFMEGEDATLSRPVSLDVKDLLRPLQVSGIHELSLGADRLVAEVARLQWRTEGVPDPDQNPRRHVNGTTVFLSPMEIVTLQVDALSYM